MPISQDQYNAFKDLFSMGYFDDPGRKDDAKEADRLMQEFEAAPHPFRTLAIAAAKGPAAANPVAAQARKDVQQGLLRAPLTLAERLGSLATKTGDLMFHSADPTDNGQLSRQYDEAVAAQRDPNSPTGINPNAQSISDVASDLPFMATPMGRMRGGTKLLEEAAQAGAPTTLRGAIGANAAMGGLAAGSEYKPGQDLKANVVQGLLGATGGAALGALMGSVPAGANVIRRMVTEARGKNPAFVDMVKQTESAVPGGFTLAQYAGVPYLNSLQLSAYNTPTVVKLANQSRDTVLKYVKDLAASADNAGVQGGLNSARTITDNFVKDTEAARTANWNNAELNATALAQSSPRAKIPVVNLNNAVQGLLNKRAGSEAVASLEGFRFEEALAQSKALREATTRLGADTTVGSVGPIRFSEIMKTTESISDELDRMITNKEIAMTQSQKDAIVGRLRSAADQDYNALAEQAKVMPEAKPLHAAAGEIMAARSDYLVKSAILAQAKDNLITEMFGPGGADNIKQAYGMFTQYGPSTQKNIIDWVRANSPAIEDGFKNQAVNEALSAARDVSKAGPDAPIDLGRFQDVIDRQTKLPIWTPTERARMNQTVDALRVIFTSRPVYGGAKSPVGSGEVAPVLISQSPVFAARVIARVMQGSKAADMMLDPAVYKQLLKIKATVGPASEAARLGLAQYIEQKYGQ